MALFLSKEVPLESQQDHTKHNNVWWQKRISDPCHSVQASDRFLRKRISLISNNKLGGGGGGHWAISPRPPLGVGDPRFGNSKKGVCAIPLQDFLNMPQTNKRLLKSFRWEMNWSALKPCWNIVAEIHLLLSSSKFNQGWNCYIPPSTFKFHKQNSFHFIMGHKLPFCNFPKHSYIYRTFCPLNQLSVTIATCGTALLWKLTEEVRRDKPRVNSLWPLAS